jgi:hypothetical protein
MSYCFFQVGNCGIRVTHWPRRVLARSDSWGFAAQGVRLFGVVVVRVLGVGGGSSSKRQMSFCIFRAG